MFLVATPYCQVLTPPSEKAWFFPRKHVVFFLEAANSVLNVLSPLQLNERSCVCVEPDLQMALQAGDCRHTQPILAAPSGTETCSGGGLFLLKGDISGLIGRVN